MLIELPMCWIVTLNIAGWLVIQLGLAWFFLQLPATWFGGAKARRNFRTRFVYEKILRIKSWKDRLPDAAAWFNGGFTKGVLAEKNSAYLHRFLAETRRGEICHWMAILFVPVFLLWNPWWGFLVNLSYSLLANLPCIMAQRFNRMRLLSLLSR